MTALKKSLDAFDPANFLYVRLKLSTHYSWWYFFYLETEDLANSKGDCGPTPTVLYPPRVDLQRFKKLIEQEDLSTIASEPSVAVVESERGASSTTPTKLDQAAQATQTDTNTEAVLGKTIVQCIPPLLHYIVYVLYLCGLVRRQFLPLNHTIRVLEGWFPHNIFYNKDSSLSGGID